MLRSIQDYAKKINSKISTIDCVALALIFLVVLLFSLYVQGKNKKTSIPLRYTVDHQTTSTLTNNSLPFGSKSGKTYTYSWCSGSSRTKPINRIYFKSKEEAERAGRTLSKLCS